MTDKDPVIEQIERDAVSFNPDSIYRITATYGQTRKTTEMSTGEEFKVGNSTVIFGGGNSLPGAPPSWEWAKEWQEKANESSPNESIQWKWDCHFKLDYDGDVVRVSSRFYPPADYYGSTWDGTVAVYVFDKQVSERKFDCATLDELKQQVETYVTDLSKIITQLLEPLKTFTEIDEPKNE